MVCLHATILSTLLSHAHDIPDAFSLQVLHNSHNLERINGSREQGSSQTLFWVGLQADALLKKAHGRGCSHLSALTNGFVLQKDLSWSLGWRSDPQNEGSSTTPELRAVEVRF